jgi:DNA (cytosine-5)-methyltransferase 1
MTYIKRPGAAPLLTVLDLFSGIGGFSYALESTGKFKTTAFSECEPYAISVIQKHWPNVRLYQDVRDVSATRLFWDRIERPDVITGGFPCTDISNAGEQAGIEGSQSGLWGEYARIIGEIRPKYAIVENVSALLSGDRGGWFGTVLRDLARIGYDARWSCISAADCGAPHHRNRVWVLAYPNSKGLEGCEETGDTGSEGTEPYKQSAGCNQGNCSRESISEVCGMDYGLSYWVDTPEPERVTKEAQKTIPRLKALGNSIVPQIVTAIGQEILKRESCQPQ